VAAAGRRAAATCRPPDFLGKNADSAAARASQWLTGVPPGAGATVAPDDGRKRKNVMSNSKMKIAYVITERNGKSYWNRIGVAFVNQDGSLNVKLEAVPVGGDLQIRDYVPREEQAGTPARAGSNGHSRSEGELLAEVG
jgi:hypothetical protein